MVRPARARLTMRGVVVALLLLIGAAALMWTAVPKSAPSTDPELASLRREAAAATAAVERLEAKIADLRTDLRGINDAGDKTKARLDKATTALWGSLDRIRASLKEQRGTAGAAAKEALAALERAESAARNLSVLEDRFEYHLRSDHGGG